MAFIVNMQASDFLFQSNTSNKWDNFLNLKIPYDANVVNTVYQDSHGLMWIGTKRGLLNYNGYNYHLCYYGKNMPDENTIQAIIQTDDSHLYIGTDNGLRKFNLTNWTFETIDKALTTVKAVRALALFDGKLWIGTREEGLCAFDMRTKRLNKFSPKEFPHKMIYALLPVANSLYVGSYGGFNVYDKTKRKIRTVKLMSERGVIVNSMAFDGLHHCIWLGTDGKLLQYDLVRNQVIKIKELSGTFLKSLLYDKQNDRLLIGTETGMLAYYIDANSFTHVEHDTHNPQSLCNNLIYKLYLDKQNNLWVATDNGISMIQQQPLIQEIKLSSIIDSTKGNLFTCMLSSSSQEYWLGGENGLLYVSHGKTIWYSTSNEQYKLTNNYIRAIYCDRTGQIWIATDGGVARLDRNTMQFLYCKIGNKYNNTNWAYGIYEDTKHRMWIATYMSGLIVMDKASLENSCTIPLALTNENFLAKDQIKSVYQLAAGLDGKLWVNTNEGLYSVNTLTRKYEKENIFMDNFVCDGSSLWLSDQGVVYKYDTKTKQKTKIPYWTSYGSVYSFNCEGTRVWVSSLDGISCIDKRTLNVFSCGNGDKHYKCSLFDRCRNQMLFGGDDCLGLLDLSKFDAIYRKHGVVITAISCDTLLMPIGGTFSKKEIKLKTNRDVSIELASYAYASHGETFYYKWNNDKEWKQLKAGNNLLIYPVMPSGRNILALSLTNPEMDKSAIVSTYCFDVPYPWYLSMGAWCFYILFVVVCITLIVLWQKRKNERMFEQKAKEKTLELAKMKMDFFVNVSHELKTPLSLVIAPLGKLLSECTNAKMRDNLKGIQRNALKLNSLIYKIVDDKQSEYDSENSIIRSHIELVSLLNNCIASFKPIVNERKINVSFSHQVQELWLNVDVVKMESIFTNLLSNAIKHVADVSGMVQMKLDADENRFSIVVKDNGCGIPDVELPLIFVRHYQGKEENAANHGTGIGLYLVKKYTEMHQGSVSVRNDHGAIFTIVLPRKGNSLESTSADNEATTASEKQELLENVLIIDDNKEVVEFLCSAFSDKYHCFAAFNGKEGLEVLQKHQVDLIIVDQMMPVMNGLDFVRNLRHQIQTENVPVVMLTAKDDFDTELQSIKAGVDVFIPKPFDFNKMMLQVARLIKRTKSIRKAHHLENMLEQGDAGDLCSNESPDEIFMKNLLDKIDSNMDKEGFNVSLLSEEMKVDQKQLYRKVKQLTGKTPVAFLRSMRLKRAAELLKQNRFAISEVMYMVGISNASYFSKCFTSEFGLTPKQFVQEHNE